MEEPMSEATPEGGNPSGETPAADEFEPITSQDDLNRIVGKLRAEERRKASEKFADYKDLQTKAAEFDKLQQANQTEAEKVQARIAELEQNLQSTRLDALRRKVAGDHKITDQDDIDLFLTGSDEETLTRQAKRLADRDADRKKNGNHVPREGNNPSSDDGGDDRAFVRQLFASE
jgi:hypothetical protein